MNWSAIGAFFGGIITAILTYIRGRNTRSKSYERELHNCHKHHEECKDRLSALETEMVVLRKLLPGGEWYRRLRLDEIDESK